MHLKSDVAVVAKKVGLSTHLACTASSTKIGTFNNFVSTIKVNSYNEKMERQ